MIMFATMIKITIPVIAPARKQNVQSMIVSWRSRMAQLLKDCHQDRSETKPAFLGDFSSCGE
jgi:hypothetical protein